MGLDGSTGLDLKTGFHGQGLVFIELVKLVILDSGFKGFVAAMIASVIIAFINGVLGVFLPDDDKDDD